MRSPWFKREYAKVEDAVKLNVPVHGVKHHVLLNPNVGSWVSLTEDEYNRYEHCELTELEWEALFLRGLAKDINGDPVELDLPAPANYPSVVVVNITTRCNLRCKYCFANCEPQSGEDMSEEVMDRVIEDMLAMPETKKITFEFQGGEASLNVKGIEKFIEKAERKKHTSDKTVQYRMEVNCVSISDELVHLLSRFNVSIGISLDGPKELNDQCRVDQAGAGSFDSILKGINKLRTNGIHIDGAVCTIGQHNVKQPKELMSFFSAQGISFKPRPVNVLGRELENRLTTNPGEWATCFREMHQEKDKHEIENFSVHIFEENVYTPVRDYICLRFPCGAAREIISVNPNGDIFPCDGFKGESAFVLGNILTEQIVSMLSKEACISLRNRTASTIKKCKSCIFRAMCCSCAYSAYGKFRDLFREDPHCADRRRIFLYLIQHWLEKNSPGIPR
jgi:radical SAM protein with 4Fe4S-binding SPASM domain